MGQAEVKPAQAPRFDGGPAEPGGRTDGGAAAGSADDGRARFAVVCAAWARARSTTPGALVERTYRFAPGLVRVRAAGRRLAEAIDRSTAHLRTTDSARPPDLTVDVWDSAETGVPCRHEREAIEARLGVDLPDVTAMDWRHVLGP